MLSTPALAPSNIGSERAAGLLQLSEVDVFSRGPCSSGKTRRAGRTRRKGLLGNLEKDTGRSGGVNP